jgi:hypothetical protein
MNTRLSPALADFAEGRWPEERSWAHRADPHRMGPYRADPRVMDPPPLEPPLHPGEREPFPDEFDPPQNGERRLPGRQVSAALVRFLIVFSIGVAATLTWQSYGNAARRMVAGLFPELGWLAPRTAPAAPPAPFASASPDQLAVLSHSLTVVRQSVDKLAADITRLQAARQDPPPVRTAASPVSAPPATVAAPSRRQSSGPTVSPVR